MNAILNLRKPSGITSQQAVSRVKRILRQKKAGHTGTLDPMATGVLLVCLGEATKISRFLLDMDKGYRARMKLGEMTDTGDAAGRTTQRREVPGLTGADILGVARQFIGAISQVPPMYSAVKVNGQPLHRLARKGIEVPRGPRAVRIYEISVVGVELPFVDIYVSCSKGTYIRTLCEDMGLALGTGAHLAALERTSVGPFNIRDSATFDELQEASVDTGRFFIDMDRALAGLPEILLDETSRRGASHGVPVKMGGEVFDDGAFIRLKDGQGRLMAIGRQSEGVIHIERVLNLQPD